MTDRPPKRLSPLTPVVRSFIVLLAAATTVVRDVTQGQIGPTATLFVLLLVGGAGYGTASWLLTKYWIESDELRVDTGVLNRQSRRVRIDRLQGVDIVQPFVARLFRLAELRMDVAGGNAREGSLAYLPLDEARRLKDLLLARRNEITGAVEAAPGWPEQVPSGPGGPGQPVGPGQLGPGPGQPGVGPSAAGPLLPGAYPPAAYPPGPVPPGVVPPGPAGAAPPGGYPPAPPGPYGPQPSGPPGQPGYPAGAPAPGPVAQPERRLAKVDLGMLVVSILLSGETVAFFVLLAGLGVASVWTGEYLGFSAMLPALLGLAYALFRRFTVNYKFVVSDTPAGLQVRRGMFELSSQTIALKRVQGVVVSEPLLWRKLGWARLDVSIAGYGVGMDDDRAAPTTVLPVGDRQLVHDLARHLLRGLDPQSVELRPVPKRARWLAPIAYRFLRVGTSERLAVSREGWFNRRTHAAPQARIQSVRLTQGPLQRRLGLADVHTDSPPGPVQVRGRHRDAAEARRLFDVEVAMTAWARHH